MVKYLNSVITVLKGAFIGGTMTVPGVSGGSMAMILGIYDKLIYSVSNVFKQPKDSLFYLAKLTAGAGVGMLLFARLMDRVLNIYPMPASFFFLGAVLGGIPIILKSARVERFSFQLLLFPILGVLCVYGISLLPEGLFAVSDELNPAYVLLQFIGGWIIAVALVLPGISTSHMLLMLGLYETVIRSVKDMELVLLLPLITGVLVGTFATSKALDKLFERYRLQTYLAVFGFLLGSLVELFPGVPESEEVLPSVLSLLIGAFVLYGVSRLERHAEGIRSDG